MIESCYLAPAWFKSCARVERLGAKVEERLFARLTGAMVVLVMLLALSEDHSSSCPARVSRTKARARRPPPRRSPRAVK